MTSRSPSQNQDSDNPGQKKKSLITGNCPRKLGAYDIGKQLGIGGMAQVYEAHRVGPHGFTKRVAVKRILPAIGRDPAFVRMFIDEAKLAARLEHPNIVQVFDFGEDKGELFLAMEMVDGTSVTHVLRTLAAHKEAVPLEAALHIALQTARALSYAHNSCDSEGKPLGVVHRDVSPANILITRNGYVKLADFGIARAVNRKQQTASGNLRGKLGYMSPEQVLNRSLDSRSDVFSLSIILAEMLMGETLFSRGTDLEILLRIRDADLSVLLRSKRYIPSDVHKLLLSGLSRYPSSRPDARVVADIIDDIIRRRVLPNNGPEVIARLLFKYRLVSERAEDQAVLLPGVRPTALVDLETPHDKLVNAKFSHTVPEIDLSKQPTYRAVLDDGNLSKPVPFPELVRMTTTGVIDADTPVAKGPERYVLASQLPELERYFATPALQWRKDEISRPLLRGELRAAILLPLIHSLAVNRETGVLYLDNGIQRKKIYFIEGRPDFIASSNREEMLGEHLVKSGKCLQMEMDMALAMLSQYGGRLGDALVNIGVLRPVELYREVASQVRSRYLEAFRWRNGFWLYVRGARSHEQTYPLGNDTYVLMRDATNELHPSELEAALAPIWEKVLMPAAMPPASISAYQVPDEWRWVIEQAKGDSTVGTVFTRSSGNMGIDSEDAMRALFLGISCQLLEAA
ncbi:MAG: protein kinase [Deltaproteobacteria bacterium]|nr:protein kinase [Deltaproteobacteria bacterium]